jgi:Sulfatase
MPTPRIDQLATQSLRLTQYLVEPGCTPSRTALMTGRYSQRAGLSTVIIGGTPNTLQPSEVTMGELGNRALSETDRRLPEDARKIPQFEGGQHDRLRPTVSRQRH